MIWLPFIVVGLAAALGVWRAYVIGKDSQAHIEKINGWPATRLRAEGDKMLDRSIGSLYISDANYYKNQADIYYRKAEQKED